jgi:hypothetical protein
MHGGGVNHKIGTARTAPNDTFKFTPLFGAGEMKLQATAKAVTPFAGMASFFAWLGALGFPKQAAAVMPFEYRLPGLQWAGDRGAADRGDEERPACGRVLHEGVFSLQKPALG